jgi:hypothetical protein
MIYNPKSRFPVDLSIDELDELVHALVKQNAGGVALNRVVSVALEQRLADINLKLAS